MKRFTLGYWRIRGLAAPLRMLLELARVTWKDETYQLKMEGAKRGCPEWKEAKAALQKDNALINLPYLIDNKDGKKYVVSQSLACELYLSRELFTWETETFAELTQLLCEVHDLRDAFVGLCYGKKGEEYTNALGGHLSKARTHFKKFEDWLESAAATVSATQARKRKKPEDNASTAWLIPAHGISAADIHLFEMMEHHKAWAAACKLDVDFEQEFPRVHSVGLGVRQHPHLASYFQSDASRYPINNPQASFVA